MTSYNYSVSNSKSEEQYLFQNFLENYKDMPSGTADFDDKPDVTFTTLTGEVIGIEFTECIYDEDLMKESEYQITFNEKVINQLEENCRLSFSWTLIWILRSH